MTFASHWLRKPNLEVGREKTNAVAGGFDQDVRQNGNRVLSLDDSLEKLQFSQKVVLSDDKFHSGADLEVGGGIARDPLRKEERFEKIEL